VTRKSQLRVSNIFFIPFIPFVTNNTIIFILAECIASRLCRRHIALRQYVLRLIVVLTWMWLVYFTAEWTDSFCCQICTERDETYWTVLKALQEAGHNARNSTEVFARYDRLSFVYSLSMY